VATLAQTEEVKTAEARRQQRLHLQTAYGQAVMWAKGYAAEEAKDAFARAEQLAEQSGKVPERYAATYGQWMGRVGRGELRAARGIAESLLREAEAEKWPTETGVANRMLGQTHFFLGDFVEARSLLWRRKQT
jgi:hypothetical protein